MLSVSALITQPPAANASFSVQAVSATDRVSTRLTPAAVVAPLRDERVTDNNPQSSGRQASPEQTETETAQASLANVTQEISQSVKDATTFSSFAPALQYNKLVSYSLVKFKPSDAGLASSRGAAASAPTASTDTLTDPITVATEYKAYNDTQLRNLSELAQSSSPIQIAG